jgi:aminopeptidase N
MALYFERHDGQAVTCDDFAQAIADANPRGPLSARLDTFKRWYAQAGTPRLQASGSYDAASHRYTLTLAQRCAPSPGQPDKQPFVIPVLMALIGRSGRELLPERMLVLDGAEQSWSFDGIDEEPVPSLLRGFSAPVKLDDGLSDAERMVLLAHDTDAFNRYEAAQRLMLDRLLPAARDGGVPLLDGALAVALTRLLREDGLDPAFKALALTPPSEGYIAEQLAEFDPQRVHAARERWIHQLAAQLHSDWVWAFEQHQVREGYRPVAGQSGRRDLANLALAMLCRHAAHIGDEVWPGRAYQRFKDAGNMSERLGSIEALVRAHSPLAPRAVERFEALAQGDALVLDKWFALQAATPEPLGEQAGGAFAKARALLGHAAFSMKNPNRVRSLLFTLCGQNPGAFHRRDAAGYVLWAERLLELDAANPQLAGRFARLMDRWRSLAEPYRSAAREALTRVAAKADLSDDVREVVTRALDDNP